MTYLEHLQMEREEGLREGLEKGRKEGREEERVNTEREKKRADLAEDEVRRLKEQIAALKALRA